MRYHVKNHSRWLALLLLALLPLHSQAQCGDSGHAIVFSSHTRVNGNYVLFEAYAWVNSHYGHNWDIWLQANAWVEPFTGSSVPFHSELVYGAGHVQSLAYAELNSLGQGDYWSADEAWFVCDSGGETGYVYAPQDRLGPSTIWRPRIDGGGSVWHLGGVVMGGEFPTSLPLSGESNCPSCSSQLTWTVDQSGEPLGLSCHSCGFPEVTAPAKPGMYAEGRVRISIDGFESDAHPMEVRSPNVMVVGLIFDQPSPVQPGFRSELYYYLFDNYGALVRNMGVNEAFGSFQKDDPNSNWPAPPPMGAPTSFDGSFADVISVWYLPGRHPIPQPPSFPLSTIKVDWGPQTFRAGSEDSGVGVLIQNVRHQRYLDHGRHE